MQKTCIHTYSIFSIDVCMQNSKVDAQCKYYNISLHFSLNNIKHLHFMYMYWHNKWIYTKSSPQANLYNGWTCRRMDGRANGCTDIKTGRFAPRNCNCQQTDRVFLFLTLEIWIPTVHSVPRGVGRLKSWFFRTKWYM